MDQEPGFDQRMQRVESLLAEVERFVDPNARTVTREIVQALMDLHGAGLARIVDIARDEERTRPLLDVMASDQLVASMLLLYDLHPADMVTRLRAVMDALGQELRQQGVGVELAEVQDGAVRVLVSDPAHRDAVEQAVIAAAPDAESITVEVAPMFLDGKLGLPLLGGGS